VNKSSKCWENRAMTAREWLAIFRNHDQLTKLRGTTFSWFGMNDPKDEAQLSRRREDLSKEIVAWRVTLRRKRYLSRPFDEKSHASVDGKVLDPSLVDVTEVASANREVVFKEVLFNGKQREDLPLTPLHVTKGEREVASQLKNMKKADLVKRIENLVSKFSDESAIRFYTEQLGNIQKKLASTKKEIIIALCEEIEQQEELLNVQNQENTKQMNDI